MNMAIAAPPQMSAPVRVMMMETLPIAAPQTDKPARARKRVGIPSMKIGGVTPRFCHHQPEIVAEPRRVHRLPATMKAPPYRSASPRTGDDITPPRESRSASIIDDETSSGSKSAQEPDYSYDCERFLLVLSFGWFLLVVDATTRRQRRLFHPDPEYLCVGG